MARALVAFVTLALLITAAGRVAAAPPTVAIRARADLTLGSVRRTADGQVRIHGELHDHASGAGLGGQTVQISLGGVTAEAITRPDGSFDVEVAAGAGSVEVALAFPGGDGIDAARTEPATVDPSKATVDMTVSTSVTPQGVLVTVVTTSDGAPLAVPVTVRISPTDKDEPHKDVAMRSGQPTLIRRVDALGAGSRRLTARFAGDTGHAAATTAVVIELASDTTTSVEAPETAAYDATIRLRGRVLDADGAGVGKVTVTAAGDDKRRLGSATTGADGKFRIDVEASLLGTGRHGLVLTAEPREAWLRGSQSPVVVITVGAPRPAPVAITIAAFAATVLTALGFVWARRRRERRAAAAPEAPRVDAPPRGGLDVARPSLVSTLRRASDHGFAGAVRDSVRTRPLAEATVNLALGADARTTLSGPDGRFAFEALPAGEWTATVRAAGHVSERFAVTIPHRGELRGARVDLVPVRERAFAIYRSAALPLLPRPELWGIWSPRQIVDHVRARRSPPALAALTAQIEEIYFSGRVPDEDVLPSVEANAAAAIAERAAGVAV
ncbi:MAG: carboxypeptidase regulatory-like domain-containing protein [Myxococcales bacterium]|nr:carboxypeptidase regulatory-like domain-containing protein [Myxococcales bacterium]MBK7194418.1 carboxypeptidase regulatory-like domain-containing protein [Myxococcales bacterium]MBP6848920.1 carboxypeptidase regulatory-like domain-containing protein [Kofleriaceae bacterium]